MGWDGKRLLWCLIGSFWLAAGSVEGAPVKADEAVLLFPTVAWQTGQGWEIEVHGLVYEPGAHRLMTRALRRALGFDEGELDATGEALFATRAQFFLFDNERRKQVKIRIGEKNLTLAPTGVNGHFNGSFSFSTEDWKGAGILQLVTNGAVEIETVAAKPMVQAFRGEVHVIPERGWSVISDIDDTIKVSGVGDRHELIRNTFSRPYVAVDGMAELYRDWATVMGAQFHYVSASPWQLYVPLSSFMETNRFPAGSFHLKQFRAKDQSILNLFESPEKYKPEVIEPLLERFPHRKFILVGDSGEKDPEIYATLWHKHPSQIDHIYIRDLSTNGMNASRFGKVFEGIPAERWTTFVQPSQLKK